MPHQILKDQGGAGDPEAIAGTRRILTKCWRMGHPYASKDPFSERLEFLTFERSVQDQFERCWSIFQQGHGHERLRIQSQIVGAYHMQIGVAKIEEDGLFVYS